MTNIDYKKELISLLKSDEETKNAMEKLEFGCKIKYDKDEYVFLCYTNNNLDVLRLLNDDLGIEEIEEKYSFEIIGLPLQERFIRMYCENKRIMPVFTINFNDLQDFDNQTQETYKQIYLSLKEM